MCPDRLVVHQDLPVRRASQGGNGMARRILAVLAGYATMFVLVFATFSGMYRGMGADRAFQPGTYQPTMLWNMLGLGVGFIAALWGGWVAAKIGRDFTAARMLAVIVLLAGVLFAIPQLRSQDDPGPRTGDVSNNDAMVKAQSPAWIVVLNPLVGALGALAGGLRAQARAPIRA